MEFNIIATGTIIALYFVYAIKRLKQTQANNKNATVLLVGLLPLLMGMVIFAGFLVIEAIYGTPDSMPLVNALFELFSNTFALIVLSTLATVIYFVAILFEASFPFMRTVYKHERDALKNGNSNILADSEYEDYLEASEQSKKEDEQRRIDLDFAYMYESNNY